MAYANPAVELNFGGLPIDPRASEYTSIVDLAKTRKFLYLVLFGDTSCTWILSGYIDIHTCTYVYIYMDLYYIYIEREIDIYCDFEPK